MILMVSRVSVQFSLSIQWRGVSANFSLALLLLYVTWVFPRSSKLKTECCRLSQTKGNGFLFYNTLNIFYLQLYGIRHMVKDHSYREREKTRCCHMVYSIQLDQVRSECLTCTFRASCCSASLSCPQAPRPSLAPLSRTEKERGRKERGAACTGSKDSFGVWRTRSPIIVQPTTFHSYKQ